MTLTLLRDRNGVVQNITSTLPMQQTSRRAKIYGAQKPLYVLTNNRTLFATELVAYPLQGYGRAIVVGENEATGGWSHPRETRIRLCEEDFGKEWWTMYVQTLRLENMATGKAFEGKGVRSDIVVEETVEEEHCRHKARAAAIEFERNRESKVAEVQDELR